MTIAELFNELEDKVRDTFIVTLKYKYDFEEEYTIENQILEYESITDSYVWLNDWYEGQTDVEVLGYMILGDVDTTKPLTCDDCVSREEPVTWIVGKDNCQVAVKNMPIDKMQKICAIIGEEEQQPEDYISRQDAIDTVVFECGEWIGLAKEISKQLKQLPPVTPSYNLIKTELNSCEDCVSRQEAIRVAEQGQIQGYEWQFKELCNLPPVTPQPKAGHWMKVTNGRGGHECDLCHEYAPSYQSGDEYLTKYCPNCGAKMEVEV